MKDLNWTKLAVLTLLMNEAANYLAVAFMDYVDGKFTLSSAWFAGTAVLYFVTLVLVFFTWRQDK